MSSNKCEGITWTAVTQDMLKKYPELTDEGFAVGDKLTIGSTPFDGFVVGPIKPAGKCETSCTFKRANVDGNEPGWKSQFVKEFFPDELRKIEKTTSIAEINPCYNDHLIEIAADEIIMDGNLSEVEREALSNFMNGRANKEDLKIVKGRLEAIAGKSDASPTLTLSIKLVDMEIKKAERKVDVAKPEDDRK